MVQKKIDNRIRVLIENGINLGHRTMFVIVGDKANNQVVILHHMLSKAVVKARPSVLWCYKKPVMSETICYMQGLKTIKNNVTSESVISENVICGDPLYRRIQSKEFKKLP